MNGQKDKQAVKIDVERQSIGIPYSKNGLKINVEELTREKQKSMGKLIEKK